MIRFFRTHFARQALTRAEADLAYAKAAYAAAKQRGDTRTIHTAFLAPRDANRAALVADIALFQTRSPRSRSGAVTSQHWVLFQ